MTGGHVPPLPWWLLLNFGTTRAVHPLLLRCHTATVLQTKRQLLHEIQVHDFSLELITITSICDSTINTFYTKQKRSCCFDTRYPVICQCSTSTRIHHPTFSESQNTLFSMIPYRRVISGCCSCRNDSKNTDRSTLVIHDHSDTAQTRINTLTSS